MSIRLNQYMKIGIGDYNDQKEYTIAKKLDFIINETIKNKGVPNDNFEGQANISTFEGVN